MLTQIESPSAHDAACAATPATCPLSDTSSTRPRACPPADVIVAATAVAAASLMSQTATAAPADAIARATAAPIP